MPAQPKESINNFLVSYDEEVQLRIEKYRKLIKKKFPEIEEQLDVPARMIAYSFGPKYADMICTIIPSKKGVKLGFYKGSELTDPKKLLTGTGKVHRHVELNADI